jgi:hypothetical protein
MPGSIPHSEVEEILAGVTSGLKAAEVTSASVQE